MNSTSVGRNVALVILLLVGSSSIAQVTTNLNPSIRAKSKIDFGFNRRSDNAQFFASADFKTILADLNPDVIRFPGGTQANYWDWRTGAFIPETDKPDGNREVVTIPTFIEVIPSRTKTVYVVNIARPTPATGIDVNASEAVLKSQGTLEAKIDDMIAALDEFNRLGKTPYAVELGNEFYFGNEEAGIFETLEINGKWYSGWNSATNQPFESNDKNEAIEISARFYLQQCKEIVTAIKTKYPEVKIAMIGTKGGNGNSSRESWNNTISSELENNPDYATLATQIDAITQHHYLNENYGNQLPINDIASAKAAIAESIQYPIDKIDDYNRVPSPYKLWITEYGVTKPNADETWASGVRYAALLYSWLARGDKVEQLHYQHLTDQPVLNSNGELKLAPIGLASRLIAQASAGMDEFQEIEFANNPIAMDGLPALYGFKFKSAAAEKLLIINIDESNINPVEFGNLFTYDGEQTLTRIHSNEPFVSPVFDGSDNIKTNSYIVDGSDSIRKFSITMIEVKNTLSNADQKAIDISIYPNPTDHMLYVRSIEPILSAEVFGVDGSVIIKKESHAGAIDISSLSSGIYFLRIQSNRGSQTLKFIKK
ncbi:hypothetical protein AAU57_08500 [Nonlabens sp. YIK11]|uniref:T9SS type A sorting domain-containing protein n=1 Tax=Nonlabens sp. YIK11 TaxID=1453349 RepID=UPI0006DCFD93|nr:T9SS type A sorting domain-containing protein [Nonlabens sp. YIK11]KQC33348.1 hypothetical protein AAU57_08500 [Nonlabens sp. YIK11]